MRHSHREARLITQRLKRHEEIMDKLVSEGHTREEASKMAFNEVIKEKIR